MFPVSTLQDSSCACNVLAIPPVYTLLILQEQITIFHIKGMQSFYIVAVRFL